MQFIVVGLLALAVLIVGSGALSERAATEEAIIDARSTTELLGRSVVEPALSSSLVDGQAAAVDRFDRLVRGRLLGDDVLRVKLWTADGRIVYSDQPQLNGEQFTLDGEELDVLNGGGSAAEVSDVSKSENRFEADFGRLLEVYTQVRAPSGEALLFEAYFSYDDVSRRSREVLSAFRPITVAGLLIFLIITGSLVWVLARRLDAASADREDLLRAAIEASDSERRRIAYDLHDGVVQELAGMSFALSAAAREMPDRPQVASRLEAIGGGVRHSLRALRSLLVEIYPPDLGTAGLAAALDDLVAPAVAAGLDVNLDVADTSGLSDDTVALVWRVAQESVRNVIAHAQATQLQVAVSTSSSGVVLEVVDNGVGFDPAQASEPGHLGLRGLQDLVAKAGGALEVRSGPSAGTTLRLEIGPS